MSNQLASAVETKTSTPYVNLGSHLAELAHQLAAEYQVQTQPPATMPLLDYLPVLTEVLTALHQQFLHSDKSTISEGAAATWLLDNFHLIERALRQIQQDLPPQYYRQLPSLTAPVRFATHPRVYALAYAFVVHEEGAFDLERLKHFVRTYQSVQPLRMGELWALPIMLRFTLVASIAQAAANLADYAAPPLNTALHLEHTGGDQEIVAHSVAGLQLLERVEWNDFFEEVSLVQEILLTDPAQAYGQMDFDTRNRYRDVIEQLARTTGRAEHWIAQQAIELAQSALQSQQPTAEATSQAQPHQVDATRPAVPEYPRRSHVGYYLYDHGRATLEQLIGYRARGAERWRRWLLAHPTAIYLLSIGVLTLLIVIASLTYATAYTTAPGLIVLTVLVVVAPVLNLVINLANWVFTQVLPPRVLPKLDLSSGIPAADATMVVIPVLIASERDVTSLFTQLELHYLRNPDPQLTFALLSDFADAPRQEQPEDQALVTQAQAQLTALNQKYAHQPFYFFHRQRQWNPLQATWMGWERKRGKLQEFNHLLGGSQNTSFTQQLGDLSRLPQVRYVITLDADTVLPRGDAARLIGTLAHPLNRAELDPQTGKVLLGYTVLQPRTAVKPTSANRSLFTRVFAGDVGLDLYTRAVSDIYQDLFGAGIYVGKGIYDVAAFEQSLAGRVPENTLLSHDLFEGIHGRVGLVSDIIVYEDYPNHYLVNVLRSHRWIRGDWQLLPWLLPRTLRQQGWGPNDLALIDRWKIFDNLRRSLVSPTLLLLLLTAWTILPGSPGLWTLFAVFTSGLPLLITALMGMSQALQRREGITWTEAFRPLRDQGIRWLFFLAFLPYESLLALDAIVTTLVRLLITRRQFLEWTTAAHTTRLFGSEVTIETTFRKMLPALLVILLATGLVASVRPSALLVAAPFVITWLLAAEIAHQISQRRQRSPEPLTPPQQQLLRLLARRTWLFYEQFVGPDDNWLPPDHFQESPRGIAAHRTSPTNIGLYLVGLLAANDFGYLTTLNLATRLRFAFDTLAKLDRYRGHFLNWIDTQSLAPLRPAYVSTVDSGNLAGCLLALKQGCLALPAQPLWPWSWWQGLCDLWLLLAETVIITAPGTPLTETALVNLLRQLQQQVLAVQNQPERWYALLRQLNAEQQAQLNETFIKFIEHNGEQLSTDLLRTCRLYAERIHEHLATMSQEVDLLLPWLPFLEQTPSFLQEKQMAPAIAEEWPALLAVCAEIPTLATAPAQYRSARQRLVNLLAHLRALPADNQAVQGAIDWCEALLERLADALVAVENLLGELNTQANTAAEYVTEMNFGFLFHPHRQLFHIGYNLDAGRLDDNYYDLLASEARLASALAIAKQDVPPSHWVHLGRPLTRTGSGELVLLSWSGTMFEYLMPVLLMRSYADTLLEQSVYAAIDQQISYTKGKQVPWGISEAGYYAFDAALNYQYRAFGVPQLGFQHGLADDLVIAPYASLLALPFAPTAVLQNLEQLRNLQLLGRYGLYEAVDFTPARLQIGQNQAIVRSYMAHHQGMILLALANTLHNQSIVRHFHREPLVQSMELFLQEQIPHVVPLQFPHKTANPTGPARAHPTTVSPWRVPVDTAMPLVHFLANGQYGLLITNAGAGYSRWGNTLLTRWRADTTCDDWGGWLYLQDLTNGALWSATRQPLGKAAAQEEVVFHPHMAEFRRREQEIATTLEITVTGQDNVELRRLTVNNDSATPRTLRVTSYGEVVLVPLATDQRHPAFVKLFIESEYVPNLNALLFRRRPRTAEEEPLFLLHMLVPGRPPDPGKVSWGRTGYESDRMRFIGRGHSPRQPQALTEEQWLTNTVGPTLDPVMALGQELTIEPYSTVQLALVTLVATSRQQALELAQRYHNWVVIERAFWRSQQEAEHELRQLAIQDNALEQFQRLLSLLTYVHAARRAEAAIIAANRGGQSKLWAFGISGDYPMLVARIQAEAQGELIEELLRAHTYWRRRGLQIDLVILNREPTNYGQATQNFVHRLIRRAESLAWINQRGGIFLLNEDQVSEADRLLLLTAARVVLDAEDGPLDQQLREWPGQPHTLPPLLATRQPAAETLAIPRPADLQFDNGRGGFSADGREYQIYLPPGESTPLPWSNVIANSEFGFLITESGGGFSWAGNSGENRLTPWSNDPVRDQPGEVLYLRDEETGAIWSPTPQPVPAAAPYLVQHGMGYTCFRHHSHQLHQTLRLFAAPDAPVKIVQLRLENQSDQPRHLTATYYLEWVLGVERTATQQYIVPTYEQSCWALLATNPYSPEFGEQVTFLAANRALHGLTTDRAEFLGRLGTVQQPAALLRIGLSNRVEAGLDPCAALQLHLDLPAGGAEEIYFLLGQTASHEAALQLIRRFQEPEVVSATWQAVQTEWEQVLGTVQVETPDPAFNLLLNRWLLYQTLACRIWARSAFYQSGGAYGFRDQLQDVMALIHSRPDLLREQILRAARHQFEEGDVLHWWHPPSGRGVRTRISDDLLWLPYVTATYVAATGDRTILAETVPFLHGEPLRPNEEERYSQYPSTESSYPLLEHCRRALRKGLTAGPHGIPLIGTGDWNDGMNRVGVPAEGHTAGVHATIPFDQGKGESIWLGWFIYSTLQKFADLCSELGEQTQAVTYRQQAANVQQAVESHGWDGQWYRRAYYDDGAPLGSSENQECQIDAIAQSWAVLSAAGDLARSRQAMSSVLERLVKWDERLILLFGPPFQKTTRDPGYVKGYLPGIRENGGQYTHAALWTIWAFAELGENDQATDLFKLINPIYLADDRDKVARYQVEPYVVAADVYGIHPHNGRGGWTWYTGSSGWMYRLGLEAILGIKRRGAYLQIEPHLPAAWPGYQLNYRFGNTLYQIQVTQAHTAQAARRQVVLDGVAQAEPLIPLQDDGQPHQVVVTVGA